MSNELPSLTGNEVVRAFEKAGFLLARVDGSHHILKKTGHRFNLSIPVHGSKPVKKGLLRRQISVAGLTVEEFNRLVSS